MTQCQTDLERPWWTVTHGPGAVVATAIHDGHDVRPEVAAAMALDDAGRLREEDPFTGQAVEGVPAHVIVHRSRFEFDLNRGPDSAV
ncbi:MAG: N-formylglutamate amidohydrolase, partial [Sphingomicrobium sp.]